jgi:hypothetical protein
MATRGGSIQEVSLDGRVFNVAADADATVRLGGMTNEVKSNGNGTARIIQTRGPWSMSGLQIELDPDRGDHAWLQDKIDSGAWIKTGITLVDSTVLQGSGQITGDFEGSTQNATGNLSMQGRGRLETQ